MKKTIIISIIIILSFLIINEFVLFPFGNQNIGTSESCILPNLYSNEENQFSLVDNAEIILIGTAKKSKWVSNDRGINTHTEILIDEIIKGSYNQETITVSSSGGCNIRLNYCVQTSISSNPQEDNKYLLFLSEIEENIYGGFSTCGGIYSVENNEVYCFAQDLENCENNKISLNELKEQIK